MDWLIAAILFLGLSYFALRKKETKQREERQLARETALDVWRHEEEDRAGLFRYSVHFPTMDYRIDFFGADPDDSSSRQRFVVRRRADGTWEALPSADTFKAELARLATAAKSPLADDDDRASHLAALAKAQKTGPAWEPVWPHIASMIETAYQRHVHQPR